MTRREALAAAVGATIVPTTQVKPSPSATPADLTVPVLKDAPRFKLYRNAVLIDWMNQRPGDEITAIVDDTPDVVYEPVTWIVEKPPTWDKVYVGHWSTKGQYGWNRQRAHGGLFPPFYIGADHTPAPGRLSYASAWHVHPYISRVMPYSYWADIADWHRRFGGRHGYESDGIHTEEAGKKLFRETVARHTALKEPT